MSTRTPRTSKLLGHITDSPKIASAPSSVVVLGFDGAEPDSCGGAVALPSVSVKKRVGKPVLRLFNLVSNPSANEGLVCSAANLLAQLWPNLQTITMLYATSASSPFGGGHRDSHAEPISVQTSKIEVGGSLRPRNYAACGTCRFWLVGWGFIKLA